MNYSLEHILEKLGLDFIPENELKSLLTAEEFDFINSAIKEGNSKIRWVTGLNLGTRALSIIKQK